MKKNKKTFSLLLFFSLQSNNEITIYISVKHGKDNSVLIIVYLKQFVIYKGFSSCENYNYSHLCKTKFLSCRGNTDF